MTSKDTESTGVDPQLGFIRNANPSQIEVVFAAKVLPGHKGKQNRKLQSTSYYLTKEYPLKCVPSP
jgi:hypothetical protein